MEIIFSLDEIYTAAREILELNPKKVILFYGEMGAGKTTLIKALSKTLGVGESTSSPTFSLVNEYETEDGQTVYHFDMYRLRNETEAYDMGLDEYLYSGQWCFIEWPEKIPTLVPQDHTSVRIKALADGKRELSVI